MDRENISPEDMVVEFYTQVNAFQVLAKKMDTYLSSISAMKKGMSGMTNALLLFCDSDWPGMDHFKTLLKDMDESWDLLQKDVSKLGDGFQDFADKFYVILDLRVKIEEGTQALRHHRREAEKMKKNKQKSQAEKDEFAKKYTKKEAELKEMKERLERDVNELRRTQRNFIVNQFRNFFEVHGTFCLEFQEMEGKLLNSLVGFLPKTK
ncbi:myc box-dependent-interacting protein 1-like [Ostrea edulis]|uniref:myc box-dependent-interacting protein 1-like n=1 Tax=Ostrea edulis TaxID=37623 RepID=UPI0020955683|nr:myc box-dependent-interacting protein 1-like [Ostrea edulis]